MTNHIVRLSIIISTLLLASCNSIPESWNANGNNYEVYERINEQAKNPVRPTGKNYGETFACYMRYSAYFNSADTSYICN